MNKILRNLDREEEIFIGLDIHKKRWHLTIRTTDVELFSGSIPGKWKALEAQLEKFNNWPLKALYEAGYSGFWLHDNLIEYGVECIVTPPSLVPLEYGNKVKTDRRDSGKLALLLAKVLLKRIHVPSQEECYHRQVVRRRRQMVRDRVRIQNRIKAELQLYGIDLPQPTGKWSRVYLENFSKLRFGNHWMQQSFNALLEQYLFYDNLISRQTALVKELSEKSNIRKRSKFYAPFLA